VPRKKEEENLSKRERERRLLANVGLASVGRPGHLEPNKVAAGWERGAGETQLARLWRANEGRRGCLRVDKFGFIGNPRSWGSPSPCWPTRRGRRYGQGRGWRRRRRIVLPRSQWRSERRGRASSPRRTRSRSPRGYGASGGKWRSRGRAPQSGETHFPARGMPPTTPRPPLPAILSLCVPSSLLACCLPGWLLFPLRRRRLFISSNFCRRKAFFLCDFVFLCLLFCENGNGSLLLLEERRRGGGGRRRRRLLHKYLIDGNFRHCSLQRERERGLICRLGGLRLGQGQALDHSLLARAGGRRRGRRRGRGAEGGGVESRPPLARVFLPACRARMAAQSGHFSLALHAIRRAGRQGHAAVAGDQRRTSTTTTIVFRTCPTVSSEHIFGAKKGPSAQEQREEGLRSALRGAFGRSLAASLPCWLSRSPREERREGRGCG